MAKNKPVEKAAPSAATMSPFGSVSQSLPPKGGMFQEIGVSGLKVYSGILNEEYLPELRGQNAIRVYRQMADGDAIVAAVLTAIGLILRATDWRVEPANDTSEAEKEAEFVEGLFEDMSHTMEDFISEALSMLPFGWAYHETVLKRRVGPDQKDPKKRSKFTDGRIGIRKLPLRSQDSLFRWEMQDDGGIMGMWQQPPLGGPLTFVPITSALLIRTTSKKNNPEGHSILRAAYKSWYLLKTIEEMEAIGIERELAGLPVVSIPAKYLSADASPTDKAIALEYQKVARDLKFNQQGGIVIPSDCYVNPDGSTLTNNRMVDVALLSAGGKRSIDTDPIVQRHQRNIARSALADFIMLGDQKGSYALSKNKAELFLKACETFLNQIAAPVNRFMIPRLWDYNGISRDLMPEVKPGRVAPIDLAELGAYIQQLSMAGAPLFPDEPLEDYLREVADLPEVDPRARAANQLLPPNNYGDDEPQNNQDNTEGMFGAGAPRGGGGQAMKRHRTIRKNASVDVP